jgi:phospholipid transport system substrate-binding protein
MRCRIFAVFIGLGLLLVPTFGQAKAPADTLKAYMDEVLDVFRQAGAEEAGALEQDKLREELRRVAKQAFDFEIMARMCLGPHWSKLNQEQQEEFIRLFIRLLEENYFGKILKYVDDIKEYSRDQIDFTKETVFSSRKAMVQSVIHYNDKQVPVDYRLVSLDEGWKVYDVSVEGVSLVQNYRSQFRDMMLRMSPAEMLQALREKVESQPEAS